MNPPTTMHVGPTAVHAQRTDPGAALRAGLACERFGRRLRAGCGRLVPGARDGDRPEHGLSLDLRPCGGGLSELGSMPWRLRCRSPWGGPADVARRSVAPAGMVHMTSAPYPEP